MKTHGQIIASSFRPHPLLRNPHAQTLFAALLRPTPALAIRRERLELDDGDFVDLGWSGDGNAEGPIAVLVHGLTGGFESKYLRGLAQRLVARGWRTVALQLRGGGPEPNRTTRLYNHGDTTDLRHLLHLLRQRERNTPLSVVGWSLGANVVLKALGEEGDALPVTAAVAVCAPLRLVPCAERLRHGFSRQYQDRLLRELYEILRRKHQVRQVPLAPGVDLEAALKARDFFELDDAFTAPNNGYRDALDYYTQCECGAFLGRIRRPTLIINADDDPFMDPAILPVAEELAPQVTLELAGHGGHVGFVAAGRFGQPEYWLEPHIEHYLAEAVADDGHALAGHGVDALA
ncbi:MAG TPA: hydrolase [Stenotrophobium sp.]|jgi:predicted alpha/beta-fold hydrolase|nr:hydrolase [Stenotrophobium sp.]